jgi:hypothetical protein
MEGSEVSAIPVLYVYDFQKKYRYEYKILLVTIVQHHTSVFSEELEGNKVNSQEKQGKAPVRVNIL